MKCPILVSLLTAVLCLSIAHPAVAQVGRVNGLVKSEDGQALKGVTITAENSDIGQSLTATSDDKGRFVIIGLRSGVWSFTAQAPGFSPQMGNLFVRMGSQNPVVAFALKKRGAANFGALAGVLAKDLQAELGAADTLFEQQRWDEAIAAYRTVLAKTPPLSALNLQIALAQRHKKDYTAAIAAYNDLLKMDPGNQKATVGIAMTHLERDDANAAGAALLPASQLPDAGREVFYALGEVETARGNRVEAAKWYERAAGADASWGKPLYKLGLDSVEAGDKTRAASFLNRVLTVDPLSPEAELARTALSSLNK
jgi:tetratricopeptide (TPR) repeat protein